MDKLFYTIPEIPPSMNRFAGRNNTWAYREAKRFWKDLVILSCRPAPNEPIKKAVVKLTYYFKDGRRRDPDNYNGKMILDGLVAKGILKDDSFDNVELRLRGMIDRDNPRTEIEVEPC